MSLFRRLCRNVVQPMIVSCLLMGTAVSPCTYAALAPREAVQPSDTDEPEVTVRGPYIYVTTQRAVSIRLYSILGQLVAQYNVQAGTTRIKAPARGVYILQAGTVTRRVNI